MGELNKDIRLYTYQYGNLSKFVRRHKFHSVDNCECYIKHFLISQLSLKMGKLNYQFVIIDYLEAHNSKIVKIIDSQEVYAAVGL